MFFSPFFFQLTKQKHNCISSIAVVAALNSHGKTNEGVAWSGLWAMQNLTTANAANAGKFVELGACAGLWLILHCFMRYFDQHIYRGSSFPFSYYAYSK